MRASGVSLQRGFAAIFAGALLLTACQVGFRELLLPRCATELSELRANLMLGKPHFEVEQVSVVAVDGHRYRFSKYRPEKAAGDDFRVDATVGSQYWNVSADGARYEAGPHGSGAWRLEAGKLVKMPRAGSGASAIEAIDELPPQFTLTPKDCELATRANLDPMYLSITELDTLARRVPSVSKFQVMFHGALTGVLANLLLPLLGLPCVLRADRRSALEGAVMAFGLCVLYFAATLLCFQLGADQVMGPVFAAWLPTVLFGSLGVTLFEAMRT
jgi:lipopolysaccharide export LptBFGC system permease protein LptF